MAKQKTIAAPLQKVRCAIYTRKSTTEGLDSDFNSLDAQRDAAESFIASQRHEGWLALPDRYDDGGFSGGTVERPALQRLLSDVESGKVDCVVVYKVDRLSRSLLDFTKIIEAFDQRKVSFVSVTQHFNTTSSMGRLTLNILLSFAQFEREIIGERIRDKVAAAKRKGKHCGGAPILGYGLADGKLAVNQEEAKLVRRIFERFLRTGSTTLLAQELNEQGHTTKSWTTKSGRSRPGAPWNKSHLYRLLNNRTYIGEVEHKGQAYPGEHEAIVPRKFWDDAHKILATNYHGRARRTQSQTPALLKGIIRCGACGKGMTLTFTCKEGKRYRYYLCVGAAKHGYDACPVKSVAAGEIEKAVVGQIRGVLRAPEIVAKVFRSVKTMESEELDRLQKQQRDLEDRLRMIAPSVQGSAPNTDERGELERQLQTVAEELRALEGSAIHERDVLKGMQNLDTLWDELFPAEQARIVQLLVEHVVVNPDGLEVAVRRNGLRSLMLEVGGGSAREGGACAPGADEGILLRIPMAFKRRGGRKEIIAPATPDIAVRPSAPPQDALVAAIIRAHRWQKMIDSGEVKYIKEIGAKLKVDWSYVRRIIGLTLLAPDIIEAILKGEEPSGLSLVKLLQAQPMSWEEQREQLGFPAKSANELAAPVCA